MCLTAVEKPRNRVAKILLVDDDPKYLLFMTDRLKAEGYKMMSASGGEEAMDLIGQDRPDLILLDIMMPEVSGIEVLSTIKNEHPEVPVVMVTAVYDREEGKKTLDLGAFDYITKPVDIDYLKTSILAALTIKRANGAEGRLS